MKTFIISLLMLPCSLFGGLDSIQTELKIQIKIKSIEMKTVELDSKSFWKMAGEMQGMFTALEMIEKELYGPSAIGYKFRGCDW